jgi:hypothetical protein
MLMRLTDDEWAVIVTLSPVWLCLPQGAGRVRMRTEASGSRWRWGEPAPSGVSRR